MAYMQHDCFELIGASAATTSRRVGVPVLTTLERQVIALAEREPLSSLSTGRRPIARALFGIEPARALADPRLEALRRFVVLSRHGRREATASGDVLVGLGFSPPLLADVRARMAGQQTRLPALFGWLAVAMLVVAAVALIASYVGELLPSTAIGLAFCLPLVVGLHRIIAPSTRPRQQRAAAHMARG